MLIIALFQHLQYFTAYISLLKFKVLTGITWIYLHLNSLLPSLVNRNRSTAPSSTRSIHIQLRFDGLYFDLSWLNQQALITMCVTFKSLLKWNTDCILQVYSSIEKQNLSSWREGLGLMRVCWTTKRCGYCFDYPI